MTTTPRCRKFRFWLQALILFAFLVPSTAQSQGCSDGTQGILRLKSIFTPKNNHTLNGHPGEITGTAFVAKADNNLLVVVTARHNIMLPDSDTMDMKDRADVEVLVYRCRAATPDTLIALDPIDWLRVPSIQDNPDNDIVVLTILGGQQLDALGDHAFSIAAPPTSLGPSDVSVYGFPDHEGPIEGDHSLTLTGNASDMLLNVNRGHRDGYSGSPIVLADTGKVIGVLVQNIRHSDRAKAVVFRGTASAYLRLKKGFVFSETEGPDLSFDSLRMIFLNSGESDQFEDFANNQVWTIETLLSRLLDDVNSVFAATDPTNLDRADIDPRGFSRFRDEDVEGLADWLKDQLKYKNTAFVLTKYSFFRGRTSLRIKALVPIGSSPSHELVNLGSIILRLDDLDTNGIKLARSFAETVIDGLKLEKKVSNVLIDCAIDPRFSVKSLRDKPEDNEKYADLSAQLGAKFETSNLLGKSWKGMTYFDCYKTEYVSKSLEERFIELWGRFEDFDYFVQPEFQLTLPDDVVGRAYTHPMWKDESFPKEIAQWKLGATVFGVDNCGNPEDQQNIIKCQVQNGLQKILEEQLRDSTQ